MISHSIKYSISRKLLFALALFIGLMPVQEVFAAPQKQVIQKYANMQTNTNTIKPGQKKLNLKQKVGQKLKQAKQFIVDNGREIAGAALFLGVLMYNLYPKCKRIKQVYDENKIAQEQHNREMREHAEDIHAYLDVERAEREERQIWADEFAILRAPIAAGANPPPASRRIIEYFEQYQNREPEQIRVPHDAIGFLHRRNFDGLRRARQEFVRIIADDAFTEISPLIRNAVYRDARFYGNETHEQFEQARDRVNAFNMAAQRHGVVRDVRQHLLAPELADDVATIGFWHLRNNPERVRLMPFAARERLIDAMSRRHIEGLQNLLAGFDNIAQEIMARPARANDFQLPTLEEVRFNMAQRINNIIQAVPPVVQ